MNDDQHRAASARRDNVTQRSNKPSQRRAAHDATTPHRGLVHVRAHASMTARAAGDNPTEASFTGLANTYELAYDMHDMFGPYSEIITAGAGARSLARADLDVPLVLQHNQLRRIARTTNGSLTLTETADGLQVDAPALDLEDRDVSYIVPKIRAGLIDEMSFAFTITRGTWSPDYSQFRIDEYDIHRGDVAIVGYGANPNTIADLRSQPTGRDLIREDETRMLMYL